MSPFTDFGSPSLSFSQSTSLFLLDTNSFLFSLIRMLSHFLFIPLMLILWVFLPLRLTLSLSLLCHSLPHSFCHSFYASQSLKRPFVLSLSLARSLTLSLSLACLHTHSLTLCLFLSLSFSLLPLLLVYNLSLDSSFSHKTQTHTIFYKNICKQAHMVQCYVFFRPMRLTNFIGGIFTVWRAGL